MANYRPQNEEHLSLDEIEAREEAEKKEKKKFNIFSKTYEDGAGVSKDEKPFIDEPTLVNFFKLVGRKINQMLSVNLLMVVGNFPIFFFLLAMSGYLSVHTTSPYYVAYAPLRGAMLFHNSPAVSALWTLFSRQAEVTVYTTADYVLFGLTALLLLTHGPVRAGITYLQRNMLRGKPVFIIQDFIDTIKRNLKQAILYGILDILITAMIVYDIVFFNLNSGLNFMMNTMFFMSLCLALMYYFMRPYIWLMIVTFDLSLFKMFKNALRFTVLGVKRNCMYLLGTVTAMLFEYFLMYAYFPLAVILPFVMLLSFLTMMSIYAAFPVIKKWMIDPYYEETSPAAVSDGE